MVLTEDGDDLRSFEYAPWPVDRRIRQFDKSRGVTDFAERPEDIIAELEQRLAEKATASHG